MDQLTTIAADILAIAVLTFGLYFAALALGLLAGLGTELGPAPTGSWP